MSEAGPPPPTRSRPWSPVDLLTLAALWGAPGHSLATLAHRFNRTPYAVYCAAARAGLPLGCPDGWESVAGAARRTGMVPRTLAAALAAAGVRPTTGWRNPAWATRGMGANRVVMASEVDRAVAAWLARESVEEAARRAGVGATVLRRWLRRAGVAEPRRGAHWRVGEGEVAAALRWRAERPPLAQHAAARGVSAKVLARRMGVGDGWRGRRWTAGEVEAALAARGR